MFTLDSTLRFHLYSAPVDMRKSFDGLANKLHELLPANWKGNLNTPSQ
jgi:hypothetical protein